MSLEFYRLILVSIPALIIFLLGGLIILGEDIKRLWPKILSYGILGGLITWSTYLIIEIHLLRQLINLCSLFLLIKFLFKFQWWSTIKVFILITVFQISIELGAVLTGIFLLKVSLEQMANDISFWLKLLLPCYFSSIIIACLIGRVRYPILLFFAKIKNQIKFPRFRFLYLALVMHTLILLAFLINNIFIIDFGENHLRILLIVISSFLLVGLNIYILFGAIKITEEKAISEAEDVILLNTTNLIDTVRSQRHDFINHLQIIYSLYQMNKQEEMSQYLAQLVKETSSISDILQVGNPLIGVLLNTKIAQAGLMDIDIKVEVKATLANLSTKAFDLTRILGNLIDNAIDAVEFLDKKDKWINIKIKNVNSFLVFTITNSGAPPIEIQENIFLPGYSTKGENHSGLGLHICKELAQKHNAKLEFTFDSFTQFSLAIPKPQ